ncbi:MAG: hypothetical protein IV100_03725 [Myxococcales bacterium]|nr:hypothetical protein [Myxococcales bacterium]
MRALSFCPIVLVASLSLACETGTALTVDLEPRPELAGHPASSAASDLGATTDETSSTLAVTPGASATSLREGVIQPKRTYVALPADSALAPSDWVVKGVGAERTVEADLGESLMGQGGAFQLEPRVVFLDGVVVTPSLHRDAPEAVLDVVLSENGSAAAGLLVEASLASARWPSPRASSCTTDEGGRCALIWDLDPADFEALPEIELATATFDVPGFVLETSGEVPTFSVFPAPSPLVVMRPGIGLQLPTVPLVPGDTVAVPVYVETTGTIPAAYDLRVEFDPAVLEVVDVTGGACAGFAAPVHNGGGLANQTGQLLMNAISPNVSDACVTDERVHVATIALRVREGAAAGALTIGCRVRDLFDTNFWKLAHDKACDVGDLAVGGATGVLLVE